MKKKAYIFPQTEVVSVEMKSIIMDSSMTVLPPHPAPKRRSPDVF